ncbi:barstar family protein [Dysosmobacter sp.]|uniref:barstar family protein n=1 Tax=Dysosmobacter sp. TaxID=2591382 RepID=UPI003AEF72F0
MKEIILDIAGINSLWTLHEYFKKVFKLPDYYGHNMDALWDCLHCPFEFPTTIVLKNIEEIPAEMKEAVDTMLSVFRDLEKKIKKSRL